MNFTFAAFDVGITKTEKETILGEILSIPQSYYSDNPFRGCKMIHIFNGVGARDVREGSNKGEFKYTDVEPFITETKKILENKIFPWMNPVGRVNVLRTQIGHSLNVHVDTTRSEIGTLQHKYRLVLNGNIDKLYFLDKNQNKVYVPQHYDSYVLDGSHPHSLDPGNEEKITLCIGSPWKGQPTEQYLNFLQNPLFTMTVSRPDVFNDEWEDPYFRNKDKK